MKSVILADLTCCDEGAVEIAADKILGIFALDAEHYLDTMVRKYIRRARPHTTRQDHRRALLAKPHWEYPATVFGRLSNQWVTDSTDVLVYRVKGERLGATKVFAEFPVV